MCTAEDELAIRTGRHEKLGPFFTQLSLCFQSWACASEEICHKFIEKGFLIGYIRILKRSRLSHDTKVLILLTVS